MKPPYPVEVVPLLPQFLTRRRSRLEHHLRAAERLGIDRAQFISGVSFVVYGDDGITEERYRGPYRASLERIRPILAAARGAGLVEERDGRYVLSARGREEALAFRRAAHEHFATLRTIDEGDLRTLADLLEQAFQASLRAGAPPKDRAHYPARIRLGTVPPNALGALEDAVQALWYFRDDCHIAAWRDAGFDGPALDVLTRVWRGEAAAAEDLAAKMPQAAEDLRDALGRLRERGLVERDDPLRATEEGRRVRQGIEDATDRHFFEPWPDEVGRRAPWVVERLAAVNAALA